MIQNLKKIRLADNFGWFIGTKTQAALRQKFKCFVFNNHGIAF